MHQINLDIARISIVIFQIIHVRTERKTDNTYLLRIGPNSSNEFFKAHVAIDYALVLLSHRNEIVSDVPEAVGYRGAMWCAG